MSEALVKSSAAAGVVLTISPHIPTNWAPWPGNIKVTFDEKSSKSLSAAIFNGAERMKDRVAAGAKAAHCLDARVAKSAKDMVERKDMMLISCHDSACRRQICNRIIKPQARCQSASFSGIFSRVELDDGGVLLSKKMHHICLLTFYVVDDLR